MDLSRRARHLQSHRGFERLETRALLAGNVTAVYTGGLTITGDDAANSITVSELPSGMWKVQGNGATINGSKNAFITSGPVSDIIIDLKNGNNSLTVQNGTLPSFFDITTGTGNDTLLVSNLTSDNAVFNLGDGNNTATVKNFSTNNFFDLNGGVGADTFTVTNVKIGSNSVIDPADGRNIVTINGFSTDSFFDLDGGAGNDTFTLNRSTSTRIPSSMPKTGPMSLQSMASRPVRSLTLMAARTTTRLA